MPKETHKRATWTTEQLNLSLQALQRGASQREVSARYGIPRRTLRNHLKSGIPDKGLGRRSILSVDQEKDLVQRLIRLSKVGMPLTSVILKHQVYRYVKNTYNTILILTKN
ncbi:helix-turn-helix psq domain [Holotrichia oblita]|uniref:Helix-turn-helix psq domain n=1 Tax=Holotrichia oblita TaxID=644536 RepID=A0ACB9TGR4_HOLOL|nr:helix-turn-helix psq domain [Holotrichia oblita]